MIHPMEALSVTVEEQFELLMSNQSLNLKLQDHPDEPKNRSAVPEDAEMKQMMDRCRPVEMWLIELRDLAYDMEDILDEFAFLAQRVKLGADPQARTSEAQQQILGFITGSKRKGNEGMHDPDTVCKKVAARLQDLEAQSKALGPNMAYKARDGRSKVVVERVPFFILVELHFVCGREKDRKASLQQLLLSNEGSEKGVCMISIIGMGGMGKTTLAQLAMKGRCHFKEQAKNIKNSDISELNLLQYIWMGSLMMFGRKTALGGISYKRPFALGAVGSKIIITTHNESVAYVIWVENDLFYYLK